MPANLIIFLVCVTTSIIIYPGFRYQVYMSDGEIIETRFFNPDHFEIEAEVAENKWQRYTLSQVDSVFAIKGKNRGQIIWSKKMMKVQRE